MDPSFLLCGAVLGFAIAAPVGPIGVLCIRRSLAEGRKYGFVSGLGAATADALYGSVTALGLTFVSSLLVEGRTYLGILGGAFLCYLGLKTFLARPVASAAAPGKGSKGLLGAYASTLLLTLTNPTTILSFAAIFAGVGVGAAGDNASIAWLVLGVFLGSALWWLVLSSGMSLFRTKVSPWGMRLVNLVSGAAISAFGLAALWNAIS